MKRESFDQRATRYLKQLDPQSIRKELQARAFTLELFGIPKAGKTTIKEMLKHFFKRKGFSVAAPTEGAEVVEWVKRKEPEYNFQTAMYAMQEALELAYGPRHSSFHIGIFDRANFDGIARMEYYFGASKMPFEEARAVEKYLLLPQLNGLFDLHICMVCEPEVAIQRELARVITTEHGETMNPQTLLTLRDAHERMWKRLKCDDDPRMIWHDTTTESPGETALVILEKVLATMKRRLAAK